MKKSVWNQKTARNVLSLYDDEIVLLNEFLAKHEHRNLDGGVSPYEYTVGFNIYTIASAPFIKCWCGEEESIFGDERMDMI